MNKYTIRCLPDAYQQLRRLNELHYCQPLQAPLPVPAATRTPTPTPVPLPVAIGTVLHGATGVPAATNPVHQGSR